MSLQVDDFRRLCEGDDSDTDEMVVSGEWVRIESGGVVHDDKVSERWSGSKGELDGDEKGLSLRLCEIGKVKARGVGEMMEKDGACNASVATSSAMDYGG